MPLSEGVTFSRELFFWDFLFLFLFLFFYKTLTVGLLYHFHKMNLSLDEEFFSILFGLSPYFSFSTMFIFSEEVVIIFEGVTFIFRAFNFPILLLSSHMFFLYAFPLLTELVNISALFSSFKSLILTCWNSWSTWRLFFSCFSGFLYLDKIVSFYVIFALLNT